jgi:hypothetical protein
MSKSEREKVAYDCGDNRKKATNHFKSLLVCFWWEQRVHLCLLLKINSCCEEACPVTKTEQALSSYATHALRH